MRPSIINIPYPTESPTLIVEFPTPPARILKDSCIQPEDWFICYEPKSFERKILQAADGLAIVNWYLKGNGSIFFFFKSTNLQNIERLKRKIRKYVSNSTKN